MLRLKADGEEQDQLDHHDRGGSFKLAKAIVCDCLTIAKQTPNSVAIDVGFG